MDLASLAAFLSLAQRLHFGRSARESNLSTSALSRTIRRLEEEAGERLFTRDNRSVALTPAGAAVRAWAREVLDGWEETQRSLAAGQEELQGEIRIYCSVAASYTVLADLVRGFRRAHPAVHIRLATGDPAEAVARVQDGQTDIAVAALPDALPRGLRFRQVAVSPLEFIAPAVDCEAAAFVRGASVPWALVPMVLTATGLSRRRADAWFRARRIRPTVYAEVSGHEAVISMVRLGCGVGIVPRIVRDRFAAKGEVRVLEVAPPLAPYVVGLCARERRLTSPLVRAFWDGGATVRPQGGQQHRPQGGRQHRPRLSSPGS
jgi:LysR family transcriptional regulator, positive regulator for ilvC